jgi:hypothetical protein
MTAIAEWAAENQRLLARELGRVRDRLETQRDALRRSGDVQHTAHPDGSAGPSDGGDAHQRDNPAPFALAQLVARFGLSAFERDLLLLCAGMELDSRISTLVAELQGETGRAAPTFALGMAALAEPHWSAQTPDAPLRAWRLIELTGPGVTMAPLRIDERVLHHLVGVRHLDERLHGIVDTIDPVASVSGAGADMAQAIALHLMQHRGARCVQLSGGDTGARDAVAVAVGAALGVDVLRVRAGSVPQAPAERSLLARLVTREILLRDGILLLDVSDLADDARAAAFVRLLPIAVLVSAPDTLRAVDPALARFTVPSVTAAERLQFWQQALGNRAAAFNGSLARVTTQFALDRPAIERIVASLPPDAAMAGAADEQLWERSRIAARSRMDGLAQRIDVRATWEDLILPQVQRDQLRTIAAHVRMRYRVYEEWGFAEKSARGLGIAALFAGPSGTGKTMAAEVLARELQLDLYRIDLASVVSKYIGETEKNLRALFDAAEGSGAVLLFDEADALFGKRSEVKDSHDRYANIETSYLLQRMESYQGLSILTTNMRNALDTAFLRRIRFVVTFPFPDAAQRAAIWKGAFPARVPMRALAWDRLAQLNVAGGQIRNIAMSAAFLAADRDEEVSMSHLAAAARSELSKADRTPSDAELRGWT